MKRVFLYVRVSTEEQAIRGLSIEAQTAALEMWAKKEGHKVIGVYTDAGISARKPASKRPELQRLLADVQDGKGDLIVFTKLDRWFRSIAEYYKVQEVLEEHRVDWRTIQEDYDTATASGRLKINIMLSVAQDEADRTSERIKAVFEMKRQKLEPISGDCPTGYCQENKRFIKDSKTEAAVSGFFRRFMESGCVNHAMECAKENGLRIDYQLARKMLSSPCYYGYYHGVDGMTPAYITKGEFEEIQSMRKRTVRKTEKNRVYLFSGLIYCGECGSRMWSRINTTIEYKFYNCSGHYMKNKECGNKVNLSEAMIEEFLIKSVRPQLDKIKLEMEAAPRQKARDYKGEIAALRAKLRKLKDLYMSDLITLEECRSDQRMYTEKIEALEKAVGNVKLPDFESVERIFCKGWEELYYQLREEEKRTFWRMMLRKIRIYPDRHIEFDLKL